MLKSKEQQDYGKVNAYGCKEYYYLAFQNSRSREYMEDEVLVVDDFLASQNRSTLFAVFDGHGGAYTSRFLREHLQE
jgi:serine/threonine protein phosphatase PrpC